MANPNRLTFGKLGQWRGAVVSLSALVALTTGCAYGALEGEDDGEPMAEEFESFNGLGVYAWQTTSTSSTPIGNTTNRTCFLGGISGNLIGGGAHSHGASVMTSGSNYILQVWTTGSHKVRGDAFCVGWPTGLTNQVSWNSSQPAKNLGAVTPQRKCFFTSITAAENGFGTSTDNVRIWNDGSSWYLGGSTTQGWVAAQARCVDVVDHGWWNYLAGPGGLVYGEMAMNSNPSGVACWPTRIEGRFASDSYNDGVRVAYEDGLLQWFMRVTNNKKGWAQCGR